MEFMDGGGMNVSLLFGETSHKCI